LRSIGKAEFVRELIDMVNADQQPGQNCDITRRRAADKCRSIFSAG